VLQRPAPPFDRPLTETPRDKALLPAEAGPKEYPMKRRFLITGGSKGIGLALANRLSAAGDDVIGIARHAVGDFPGTLHLLDLSNRDPITKRRQIHAGEHLLTPARHGRRNGKMDLIDQPRLSVVAQRLIDFDGS